MKPSSCLVVLLLLFPLSAISANAAGDGINLAVAKGPGIDDVTLTWTAGHGGPYTVFLSTVPPPEALPGNAIGTTGGLSWTQNTPIAPGVLLFLRVLGAGCVIDSECPTGFCRDGFCCNTSCIGTCSACDLPGSQGTCTPIPSGQDPGDECISGQACDGAGACAPCPAEICDGQDNDCDGQVDEGNPGGGAACNTGLPGVCALGTTVCQGGAIACQQNVSPSAESCDGLDNNCNGQVDEGNPGGGAACNTGLPGVCAPGTTLCQGGAIVCVGNVSPSADIPDENFLDTNCDGIDGDLTKAVFVSTTGLDTNLGTTPGLPVRTIAQGVAIAAPGGRNQVLVMTGVYATESQIVLKQGVGIYGNYTSAGYTTRTATLTATQVSPTNPTAVSAVSIVSPTDIQFLFIQGANASTTGQSAYGILATNSSGLRVRFSRVQAGNGAAGAPGGGSSSGPSGGNGGLGAPGCENDGVIFCGTCSRPSGGVGGTSSCGGSGGSGGPAAFAGSSGASGGGAGGGATPGGQGNWNTPLTYWGVNGAAGVPGVNGPSGLPGYAAVGYSPQNGGIGGAGSNGRGGGGGGGGGDGTLACDSYGGGGGGGGGGGCGTGGATGGISAGGSFAVYLWASNALIQNCELRTSNGGAGGSGGTSGVPGVGGLGGRNAGLPGAGNNYGGSSEQDDGSNGGRGGDGGSGGRGGHGGGAAGGPSIGVVQAGGSSVTIVSPVFVIGVGGAGGASSGIPGPVGLSASVHTP